MAACLVFALVVGRALVRTAPRVPPSVAVAIVVAARETAPHVPSHPATATEQWAAILAQTQSIADRRAKNAFSSPPVLLRDRVADAPVGLAELNRAMLDPIRRETVPGLLKRAQVNDLVTLAHEPMFSALAPQIISELLSQKTGVAAVTTMLDDPQLRLVVLESLRGMSKPQIAELFAGFDATRMETRFATARAIGLVCDESTVDRLIEMSAGHAHHREALAALVDCPLPPACAFIVSYQQTSNIRAQELRAIQREYPAAE